MSRMLLLLLLTWVALAPTVANACVADCGMAAADHVSGRADVPPGGALDCHTAIASDGGPRDSEPTHLKFGMDAACLVAGLASIAGPILTPSAFVAGVDHSPSALRFPSSRTTAPPQKPPQA